MPWADYQKSYRSVALQLRSKIPGKARRSREAARRAAGGGRFDYHASLRPAARLTC